MSSMNFNPFQNWFEKPPNPVPSINFIDSFFPKSQQSPKFASIGLPKFLKKQPQKAEEAEESNEYKKMAEQFLWECENRPDYRHAPEVDKILSEDPLFEKKENPSPEEVEVEEKWWERFRASPVVQFMARAEEITDDMNKMELEANDSPYRREDRDLWRAVPHVPGLDGRPMPRKAIKSDSTRAKYRSIGMERVAAERQKTELILRLELGQANGAVAGVRGGGSAGDGGEFEDREGVEHRGALCFWRDSAVRESEGV